MPRHWLISTNLPGATEYQAFVARDLCAPLFEDTEGTKTIAQRTAKQGKAAFPPWGGFQNEYFTVRRSLFLREPCRCGQLRAARFVPSLRWASGFPLVPLLLLLPNQNASFDRNFRRS